MKRCSAPVVTARLCVDHMRIPAKFLCSCMLDKQPALHSPNVHNHAASRFTKRAASALAHSSTVQQSAEVP